MQSIQAMMPSLPEHGFVTDMILRAEPCAGCQVELERVLVFFFCGNMSEQVFLFLPCLIRVYVRTFRSCSGFRPQPLTLTATPPKPTEFAPGWSQDHKLAERKELLGGSRKGPIEFSLKPSLDPSGDHLAPLVCKFKDGATFVVEHITQAPLANSPKKATRPLQGKGWLCFPEKSTRRSAAELLSMQVSHL